MNITLNRLVYRQKSGIGGMRWVFKQNAPTSVVYIGGALSGDMKAGDVIFAGDFAYYDWKNRLIYHLNQFELAKDLANTDTEVYFYNTVVSHNMRSDMFIMAEPEDSTSKGKAVSCSTLEKTVLNGKDVYKLTITAGSLGTGTVGDLYVEAVEAGESVEPKIKEVNTILATSETIQVDLADVEGDDFKGQMTMTPYYHCTVMTERVHVPKIAPANKCAVSEYYEL